MRYDSITLDCFVANQNIKIEKQDNNLLVSLKQQNPNYNGFGILVKNVEFDKNSNYIMHINVKLHNNAIIHFYSNDNDVYNSNKKIYLVNGKNEISIEIKKNSMITIGFLFGSKRVDASFSILDMVIINKKHNVEIKMMNDIVNTHFNSNVGFGGYKDIAINLLKETIEILDEFDIDYFLISGTLLGYVRHNDFIPWDDDIDLIVSSNIFDKWSSITQKYNKPKFLTTSCKWIMKSCYGEKIILENEPKNDWPTDCKWTWPFIDLFIFGYDNDKININFFNRKWNINKFFPKQIVSFLGLQVSIPNDPHYFLKMNYGSDFMTIFKSTNYCHKQERGIGTTVSIDANLLKYNSKI